MDASENTIMMKTLKFGTHISKGFSLFLIGGFMLAGCGGTTGQIVELNLPRRNGRQEAIL